MKIVCDCGKEMAQVNRLTTLIDFAKEDYPNGGRIDEFVCDNCGNAVHANLAYHMTKKVVGD
jgi:hypothetical protein